MRHIGRRIAEIYTCYLYAAPLIVVAGYSQYGLLDEVGREDRVFCDMEGCVDSHVTVQSRLVVPLLHIVVLGRRGGDRNVGAVIYNVCICAFPIHHADRKICGSRSHDGGNAV